jgi:hypothetical protein
MNPESRPDFVPLVGAGGSLATFELNVSGFLAVAVPLATLGYILTKWFFMLSDRYGKKKETRGDETGE